MYVKLFSSIYQGTLRGKPNELLVFTNLLAHADQHGVVDMHWNAIAEETGLSADDVKAAILNLEAPDPESRSPELNGRRISRLDQHRAWGWHVVNYSKYRAIRDEDDRKEQNRLAQERWRQKHSKSKGKSAAVSHGKPPSSQAEAEAEAEAKKIKSLSPATPSDATKRNGHCPQSEIVALYHELVPTSPRIAIWNEARQRVLATRWRESEERQSLEWWRKFFAFIATSEFLTGRSGGSGDRKPFTPSLDWILKPANIVKIIEGNYH